MNLSVIEQMARTGDISADAAQYLVRCRAECEWLDYKLVLQLNDDKQLCDFTRDVIAIKNTGGGYIMVGVADRTWELQGLPSPLPYDAKLLRDKVRKCSGLELDIDIVHHEVSQSFLKHRVALIYIRASQKRRKRRTPSVVAIDYVPKESFGLRRGEIYIRKGDSTVRIRSEQELEDLLDALESATDDEARRLQDAGTAFAINEGLNRLLETGFEKFIGRQVLRERIVQSVVRDPRIWIVNVHGPGGVGKSAAVNWAAHEFLRQKKFESIIQLTAKETALTQAGIKTVNRNLYSLENLLDQILLVFLEDTNADLETKKRTAVDILSTYSTLLVLDNMETITDGRILSFMQDLPVGTKAKILMTSRTKTGGWELPIPVSELNPNEIREFVNYKRLELDVPSFPLDEASIDRVARASGGLPLAIQWIMGRFKKTRSLGQAVGDMNNKDSPVLEFSFRNIWNSLAPDARSLLGILTIFENPPRIEQIAIATAWSLDRIRIALDQLTEVTLVTPQTHPSDGRIVFTALPITLSFARLQLGKMGTLEADCRRRYQRYTDQINLHESEVAQFANIYQRYGITDDNTRRAVILCRRAESESTAGNQDGAEMLYAQARELAPASSYVLAMSAGFEISRHRVGFAIGFAQEACKRASKKTGKLCNLTLARALEIQNDKNGALGAIERALEYDEKDVGLRFRYARLLWQVRRLEKAVLELTNVIEVEKKEDPARQLLLDAYRLRIICYTKQGQNDAADRDVESAKEVLRRNPHLQRLSYLITELEAD